MLKRIALLSTIFVSLAFEAAPLSAFAEVQGKAIPPAPTSYVYDETGSLQPQFKEKLFRYLSNEDVAHGNQIVVAFFNSLDNEDLVDYTNRVFAKWNPGQKGKNNGLLLAAFIKEHKIRIEVGYGLEPYVTDAKSKDIILNDLEPAFKEGDFDRGVGRAVTRLVSIVHTGQSIPDDQQADGQTEERGGRRRGNSVVNLIFFAIVLFVFLRPALRGILLAIFPFMASWALFELLFGSYGSSSYRGGGGWGGGGWGGGGFGGGDGGGFSGGGGSSGGGGASGGW